MGIGDEIAGKVKETVGKVVNNGDLEAEGAAQADKGKAEVDAAKAQTEAKAHEAKAEVADAEMQSHQD